MKQSTPISIWLDQQSRFLVSRVETTREYGWIKEEIIKLAPRYAGDFTASRLLQLNPEFGQNFLANPDATLWKKLQCVITQEIRDRAFVLAKQRGLL